MSELMGPIGLVGFGAMGRAFAELMTARGASPIAFDTAEEARVHARRQGCPVAGTAAELAHRCQVVQVIVRTDADVVAAVTGPDGVLAGARPGTLVMVQSSVAPQTTISLLPAADEKGVALIDACPSGVPDVVRAGNATLLVGGPADVVEMFRPNLELLGKHVLHMGGLGSGHVAKLVHNLVSGAQRLLLWDAARISEAAGIPYPATLEMLRCTERERGSQIERWDRAFAADGSTSTPHVGFNVVQKDIPLAVAMVRELALDLPIVAGIEQSAAALITMHATNSKESALTDVTQQAPSDEPRTLQGPYPPSEFDEEAGVALDAGIAAGWVTHHTDPALQGYSAVPLEREPTASVLVIHENKGVTPYIEDVCRRLARRGYRALAPDLLSRAGGSRSYDVHEPAIAALRDLPTEDLVADLVAWNDELLSNKTTSGRLGVIGFCFGGRTAWRLATVDPRLSVVAAFYGGNPPIEAFGGITAPVLGIYGEKDTKVTGQLPEIEKAMAEGGKSFEYTVFPGAGHAFHNDLNPRRYHAESARLAWVQTMEWFGTLLA